MNIFDIETPAVLVDREKMDENTVKVQKLIRGTSMELYPHYKSHKCVQLARYQVEHGAKGITCAKLSEEEDIVAGGIRTVVIANQVVQPQKVARLAGLAAQTELYVCVDAAENVLALEKACAEQNGRLHILVRI